jgi:hypothetical protein
MFVERKFTNLKEIENETPLVVVRTHLLDGLEPLGERMCSGSD